MPPKAPVAEKKEEKKDFFDGYVGKEGLSQDANDFVDDKVIAELDAEAEKKKDPNYKPEEEYVDEDEESDVATLKDGKKEEKSGEEDADDDNASESSDEDDGTPETETSETGEEGEDEEAAPETETGKEESPEDRDKRVNAEIDALAKEDKIPFHEAKKEYESIQKVKERYQDDPVKLAKTVLHERRAFERLVQQVKSAQLAAQFNFTDEGVNYQGKKYTKENLVEQYRKSYPAETEGKENDVIYDFAKIEFKNWVVDKTAKDNRELKSAAKEKVSSMLSNLPEEVKKYSEEVSDVFNRFSAGMVADTEYDPQDVYDVVLGRHMKELIKEEGDRQYKRGLEKARVLGEKGEAPKPKGGSGGGKKKSPKIHLTAKQKEEALEMYEGDAITDEKKFEYYMEDFNSNKTKKEK